MDFDLPDELRDLQSTVRRLAQDKVKPRAREIDKESASTRRTSSRRSVTPGCSGCASPRSSAARGRASSASTVAIEEVAKYSNTAALMLLLTRLPTGPVLIAGTEEQKQRYLPGIADGTQRAAFGLSEPQAGSDVMGMRTRAVPDAGDRAGRVGAHRHQVLDVRRA